MKQYIFILAAMLACMVSPVHAMLAPMPQADPAEIIQPFDNALQASTSWQIEDVQLLGFAANGDYIEAVTLVEPGTYNRVFCIVQSPLGLRNISEHDIYGGSGGGGSQFSIRNLGENMGVGDPIKTVAARQRLWEGRHEIAFAFGAYVVAPIVAIELTPIVIASAGNMARTSLVRMGAKEAVRFGSVKAIATRIGAVPLAGLLAEGQQVFEYLLARPSLVAQLLQTMDMVSTGLDIYNLLQSTSPSDNPYKQDPCQ